MKTNYLDYPKNISLRKAFAVIEAGRKMVTVSLNAHHDTSKRELGYLFRDSISPMLDKVRNPKLTAKCARITLTVYAPEETFDMGAFWLKADYLRSVVLEVMGITHAGVSIRYVRNRRKTAIDVELSWREALWDENTVGLRF